MTKHQSKQFLCKSSKAVSGRYLDGLASRIQMYSLPFLTLMCTQFLMVPVLPSCSSSTMEKPTKRLKELTFLTHAFPHFAILALTTSLFYSSLSFMLSERRTTLERNHNP